jgi:hypothetical protein
VAPSMHVNLGFAVAMICIPSGVFLLYNGISTSEMNQVFGGATLVSIGLVTTFLTVKGRLDRSRTFR